MYIKFFLRLTALLLLYVSPWPGSAFAETYHVENGGLYRLDASGAKQALTDVPVNTSSFAEGGKVIYWAALAPEADKAHKNLEAGIYFFDVDGKFLLTLKHNQADDCDAFFSPDGKLFVLGCGQDMNRSYELYKFEGLEKKKIFQGLEPGFAGPQWLDQHRFAFTLVEENSPRRSPDLYIPGWQSVVIYDSSTDEIIPVARASATEDYIFSGADLAESELVIDKYWVDDEKDWADDERIATEGIAVPIPAPGGK